MTSAEWKAPERDPVVDQQIAFGEYAINEAMAALSSVKARPDQDHQRVALLLYASIVELGGGVLALADAQHYAGIPVLLRSMYEAQIDFQNVILDPQYVLNMEAAEMQEMYRLLLEAPKNPLLSGVTFDVAKETERCRIRLAQLQSQGRPKLEIKERARLAGREQEHAVHYRLLCLDGHNNLSALADRHAVDEPGRDAISMFGAPHLPSLRSRLYRALAFLVDATLSLHVAFQTSDPRAAAIAARFDADRAILKG